jgi:nucleoside-diphosphate-sugar epimerase
VEVEIMYLASEQKGDTRDTLADNRKARESLGWIPKITVHEGIEPYVTWVKRLREYQ